MFDIVDWIKSWNDVADTFVSAILFYVLIVALVRIMGKRSTSQLNNFDWIINITVGSLAASGILLDDVTAIRAAVAILVIMGLQFALTWGVLRWKRLADLVKARPTMLVQQGDFLRQGMRKCRVSEHEIEAALREHGIVDLGQAQWVILETDGRITVIERGREGSSCTDELRHVERVDDGASVRMGSRPKTD